MIQPAFPRDQRRPQVAFTVAEARIVLMASTSVAQAGRPRLGVAPLRMLSSAEDARFTALGGFRLIEPANQVTHDVTAQVGSIPKPAWERRPAAWAQPRIAGIRSVPL
jgi:hypothetical protein